MRSCTTSTNAAVSWRVTSSRRATSATNASSIFGAADRVRAAVPAGATPERLERLDAAQLDLEHRVEPGLVAEQHRQVGGRVAGDHAGTESPEATSRRTWRPSNSTWSAAS